MRAARDEAAAQSQPAGILASLWALYGHPSAEKASEPRAGDGSTSEWPGGLLDLSLLADLTAAVWGVLLCMFMCARRLIGRWKAEAARPEAQAQAPAPAARRWRRKRARPQPSRSAELAAAARSSVEQLCVVCMAEPRTMSFVHGDSAHLCCCAECAAAVRAQHQPCPLCRQPIETVVRQFW